MLITCFQLPPSKAFICFPRYFMFVLYSRLHIKNNGINLDRSKLLKKNTKIKLFWTWWTFLRELSYGFAPWGCLLMPTTTNISVTIDCIEIIPNIYKPNVHSHGNDLIFQLHKDASSLLFQGIKTFIALLLSVISSGPFHFVRQFIWRGKTLKKRLRL